MISRHPGIITEIFRRYTSLTPVQGDINMNTEVEEG